MPRRPPAAPLTLAALAAALALPAAAQTPASSVLERSPNMVGGWGGELGTIHFNFLHRFTESGPPQHQISNSPTFVVAAGLPWRTTAGFAYATSSDVAPGMPNEWEFFGRAVPFRHGNRVADVSVQLGYNQGAASTDGELAVARRVGPVRLLAAGRAFSNAFDGGRGRSALAGGASVRLWRHLAVAGDAGTLTRRRAGERVAWSAGLQLGIPNAPHSFSIQATNTNTATLEGVSRGTARTRYGFEYTVPITLARYIPALRRPPPRPAPPVVAAGEPAASGGDTVRAGMQQLAYAPAQLEVRVGTTVVWTNDAPLAHTVTADDASFDSGLIDAGKRWSYTFTRAGRFPFHCTPHPFMKGVVVVR
jgi:plastocyanin